MFLIHKILKKYTLDKVIFSMVSHMVFLTKLCRFWESQNLVTSSPWKTKKFQGLDDDFGLKRPNHHLGPEWVHPFRAKKSMVYGETFLRNFKFYAKNLTKLHDLTEWSGSDSWRPKNTWSYRTNPGEWLNLTKCAVLQQSATSNRLQ